MTFGVRKCRAHGVTSKASQPNKVAAAQSVRARKGRYGEPAPPDGPVGGCWRIGDVRGRREQRRGRQETHCRVSRRRRAGSPSHTGRMPACSLSRGSRCPLPSGGHWARWSWAAYRQHGTCLHVGRADRCSPEPIQFQQTWLDQLWSPISKMVYTHLRAN